MTDFEAEDVKTLEGTVNLFTDALEKIYKRLHPLQTYVEGSTPAKDVRKIIEDVRIANNKWVNRNKFEGDKKQ